MADVSGQITQAAAPGSLLRTVAESAAQDPSKIQTAADPNSPIRALGQNPLESTIPSTTPRVLNVVGAQDPNVDYTGLHSMLSSIPVPPPHVASALIRAIMTPPGANGGVVGPQPYVAPVAPSSPAPTGPTNVTPSAPGQGPTVSPASVPTARPALPTAAPMALQGPLSNSSVLGANTYHPSPVAHIAQQTHQNLSGGINPFIGGSIRGAENAGASALKFLSPLGDILGGAGLSDFITNRLGLGGWFNPKQAG